MKNFINLTGNQFGRLKVLYEYPERGTRGDIQWLCECDCGVLHLVTTSHLSKGLIRSCGCLLRDSARDNHRHGAITDSWDGLIYNKDTGKIYDNLGQEVKYNFKGYIRIQIHGKAVVLSRLIWENYYGKIPKGMIIDHINRDIKDNRLCNLRLTDHSGNNRNRTKSQTSTSKYRGVSKSRNSWAVYANNLYIGYFSTEEEAAHAWDAYVIKIGDNFRPLNFPELYTERKLNEKSNN